MTQSTSLKSKTSLTFFTACVRAVFSWFFYFILFALNKQMYGRYTQELGVYAKEEAARLRDGGGLRRNTSVRGRAADVLEFEKDPCAKCQRK